MGEFGWKVNEYLGSEVYMCVEHLKHGEPMTSQPGEGDQILVANLRGWVWASVKTDGAGRPYAADEHYVYPLEFCEKRECWVSMGVINKRCIDILKAEKLHRHTTDEMCPACGNASRCLECCQCQKLPEGEFRL